MNKIQYIIKKLEDGETIIHREGGNSMSPIIKNRQPVMLKKVDPNQLSVGDIVFCRVRGNTFTHLIKAIKKEKGGMKFQIGNNHGDINGWTTEKRIYGKVIKKL